MPEFKRTPLEGVVVIVPKVFGDDRGFFMETFNARDFREEGLPEIFVQDNHSRSSKGVLRGLHYQYPRWQGKLVRCLAGRIFDVAVDICRSSPTFGQWYGTWLDEENRHQMYVPPGFAHGFAVESESADVAYKCTDLYVPEQDAGIRFDDPDVGVEWPIENVQVSDKDAQAPALRDLADLAVES